MSNRKPSPQFLARTRIRAYYLWQATGDDALTCWLAAEATERKLVAKKTASARASRERHAVPLGEVVAPRKRLVIESPAYMA